MKHFYPRTVQIAKAVKKQVIQIFKHSTRKKIVFHPIKIVVLRKYTVS